MRLIKLESIDSTHTYLKELIKTYGYTEPLCVYTDFQTSGIGSRGNEWEGVKGNLFFSFVMHKDLLPKDLPIQSTSIYFSYLLKSVLAELGSKVWLKWPNDFYFENKKIGGTITNFTGELFYCGIGLNIIPVNKNYGNLDIKVPIEKILNDYFQNVKSRILWKYIFSEFKIEFTKSINYQATVNNKKTPLKNAILNEDGSIQVNNEKVFSLR